MQYADQGQIVTYSDEGGNDYPVKAMGIDSIAVDGWETTAYVIEGVLGVTE